MKGLTLLLVDDETATREGLCASLDFVRLGIDRVLEASNGQEGLRIASSVSPDIIISDVRMPRMDGVRMLERVRSFLPDCVFIFMSGYSDKEYLKAAIRLRAVSYVEKPLRFPEVEQALRDAVALRKEILEQKEAADLKETVTASRLALRLTSPILEKDLYEFSYLQERYGKYTRFPSAATILYEVKESYPLDSTFLTTAEERIKQVRTHDPFHVISAEKHPGMFVFHIFRENSFGSAEVLEAARSLAGVLPKNSDFYIVCGTVVSGVSKLYDSYASAAVLLEQAYFLPVRSVCSAFGEYVQRGTVFDLDNAVKNVMDSIGGKEQEPADKALAALYKGLSGNTIFPRHTVKAAYYRIASQIVETRRNSHLAPTELTASMDSFIYGLSSCFSYDEMHNILSAEADDCFKGLSDVSSESTQVYLIREYISAHYDDPFLSTKEISEYIMLSASYACTLFKTETGKTLNQYLTEYRMEKAKKFLSDPRGTVANIASRCGYNDSNYFGKAFKKYTGLSPSEYRESLTG